MAKGYVRNYTLTKDTLLKIAMAGGIIIAAGTSPFFLNHLAKEFFYETIEKAIRARAKKLRELEKRKLISYKELGGGEVKIELTHQGKYLVRLYDLEDMKLKIPAKWDGMWRVIIYDIPLRQRKASDALREKFKQLGLYQLQRSVWVSPYECLAEIEFLCVIFDINMNQCIHYFKTKEIPKAKEILKFFSSRSFQLL